MPRNAIHYTIRHPGGALLGGAVGLMVGLMVVICLLHGFAFIPAALFGQVP
jgi:hypothetical protein